MLEQLIETLKNDKTILNPTILQDGQKITFKVDILINKDKYIEHQLSFNMEETTSKEAVELYRVNSQF